MIEDIITLNSFADAQRYKFRLKKVNRDAGEYRLVCANTGILLIHGNILWIKSQIKKMNLNIINKSYVYVGIYLYWKYLKKKAKKLQG
ncbi:MAG TPA: hypothetical protein VI815_02640 [Candidatus Nanoarchaeia archaeon]|nr:hypothetical protein [Candidatus Nanoarchaeia archaeon]